MSGLSAKEFRVRVQGLPFQEVEYRAPRCKMVSTVDVEEKTWQESHMARTVF